MSVEEASKTVVNDCLQIKKGEDVLVIVDPKSVAVGESLLEACLEVNAEAALIKMIERTTHGEEPPKFVAAAMKNADVVLAPTTKSLSHTQARIEACKNGARIATMPGITEDMMIRTLGADYDKISNLSKKFAAKLDQSKEVKITTAKGTELSFSIAGRKATADTGIIVNKGEYGNLPAGEAFTAPVEGSANGTLVIDGAIAGINDMDEDIVVTIKDGLVKKIEGGKAAAEIRELLSSADDENVYNIAELGIGTNEEAQLSSSLLEAEKVFGTVHIAFGDNASMGGNVEAAIHIDGVILEPNLYLDGEAVIEKGKHLI
ncbi:aminopeptidase [Halanaerobium hydrogeniformans]|uniref:Leucyl aminopeptidase n=1 Tax=Halanaerobium hydrogeniformans TaxID=656519 RepID=E4RP87_HALHG|nr:aminopeptidase [Halanaerobium hydrogeniformans]ADQ13772.1 hypothetical protein Halsa_0295 [Halanaerobium hydrogeniformans]